MKSTMSPVRGTKMDGKQDMAAGPPRRESPSGEGDGDGRGLPLKVRLTPQEMALFELAFATANDTARQRGTNKQLTKSQFFVSLLLKEQRQAESETCNNPEHEPNFLHFTPLVRTLSGIERELERVREELGHGNGLLKLAFSRFADDGPATRAAIGEAIGDVRDAISTAEELMTIRCDSMAMLKKEMNEVALRIARYAR